MSTHSTDGREWARLSQLKVGSRVACDRGFTCGLSGKTKPVNADPQGMFVRCACGRHYLDGQFADDGDHLVGMWPIATEEPANVRT